MDRRHRRQRQPDLRQRLPGRLDQRQRRQSRAYGYDADSLLTQAGSLTLSRNAQNGLLTGTALGSVSDTLELQRLRRSHRLQRHRHRHCALGRAIHPRQAGPHHPEGRNHRGVATTYDYGYDLAGRLVGVSQTAPPVVQLQLRRQRQPPEPDRGGVTVTGTYDAQDRLTQYGAPPTPTPPTANCRARPPAARPPPTSTTCSATCAASLCRRHTIDYLIDGSNRRIGKKVNGALVQGFLYQDQPQAHRRTGRHGKVVSRFVYATGVNVPDYMIKGGVTYRIITDHLGSPRLVVNIADGSVIQRMDYDEFGNVLSDTNPGFQPFGFAGGLYDRDTGLVRFGARDYDAEIGRWTAKDPILFAGGDTNLYGYVVSDPVNLIDRYGDADNAINAIGVYLSEIVGTAVVTRGDVKSTLGTAGAGLGRGIWQDAQALSEWRDSAAKQRKAEMALKTILNFQDSQYLFDERALKQKLKGLGLDRCPMYLNAAHHAEIRAATPEEKKRWEFIELYQSIQFPSNP